MRKFSIGEKVKIIVGDMPPIGSIGYIKDIDKSGICYIVVWHSTFGSLHYKFDEDELETMK